MAMVHASIGAVVAALLVGAGAAPLAGAASPAMASGSASLRRRPPPCTRRAITKAVHAAKRLGPVSAVGAFACAGRWAYADVTIGTTHGFDAVVVLRARGSSWAVAHRATACNRHLVPRPIYRRACTTS